MNLRALPLLAGLCVLAAGCSSGATGTTSTPSPTPTAPVSATAEATNTVAPAATARTGGDSGTTVAVASDPMKAGQHDLQTGNYLRAEQEFKHAISTGKSVPTAYSGLGAAAAALNDYKTSYAAYRKALKMKPNNAVFVYGAARGALYTANYKQAVTYSTQLIQLQPQNEVAYHLRMLAYGRLLKGSAQLKDARKIVQLKPNDPQANNDLGIAYANTKQFQRSLATFGRAIKLQPKNYSFYQNRAVVEDIIKDRSGAETDIRHAIALAPDKQTRKVLSQELSRLQKQ